MKIEMYKDKAEEWRFRIKGDNGEIMAQSEGYRRFRDAFQSAHEIQPDASFKILGDDDESDAAA